MIAAAQNIAMQKELEALHRGMVLEIDRRHPARNGMPRQPSSIVGNDVERDVAEVVGLIRVAAKEIGDLRDLARNQDVAMEELKAENGLLARQEKIDAEQILRLERDLVSEKERSAKLEAQIGARETQLRRLEDRCAGLQSNLSKVTGAIHERFASLSESATRRLSSAEP